MCNDQYSESGAPIAPTQCAEYGLLKSDRDRLAGVVAGMEEQGQRNLDALRRAKAENARQKSIIASLNEQLVTARTRFAQSALLEADLRRENARLREALKKVQWWGPHNCQVCAWCGHEKANGHTQDCIVGNALKEVGSE